MDSDTLLERLRPLVDNQCGVLREPVELSFPPPHDAHLHGYSVGVGRLDALHVDRVRSTGDVAGHGTSLDQQTALVRATCEALERYCASMPPVSGVLTASAEELGENALDPRRLPQCSHLERARGDPRHRLRAADPTTTDRWVRGYSLNRGREAWLPLTAVYLGLPDPLDAHLVYPESTGFAAGSTYDGAVLSALCEVIERDSLALWWLHQLPFPRIEAHAWSDPELAELVDRAHRAGVQTHLFDLTSDLGVPVVGVIQVAAQGSPRVVTMGACRPSGAAAAVRVVEEAGSLRVAMARSAESVDETAVRSGLPLSPVHFGMLYAGDDAPARFVFATDDAPVRSSAPADVSGADPVRRIVETLDVQGIEVFVVDVTLPEVRDAGLVVVRVVVPELMRISFSHGIRYLAHPRLYAAPKQMGYGTRTEDTVTDDPIPFA